MQLTMLQRTLVWTLPQLHSEECLRLVKQHQHLLRILKPVLVLLRRVISSKLRLRCSSSSSSSNSSNSRLPQPPPPTILLVLNHSSSNHRLWFQSCLSLSQSMYTRRLLPHNRVVHPWTCLLRCLFPQLLQPTLKWVNKWWSGKSRLILNLRRLFKKTLRSAWKTC